MREYDEEWAVRMLLECFLVNGLLKQWSKNNVT